MFNINIYFFLKYLLTCTYINRLLHVEKVITARVKIDNLHKKESIRIFNSINIKCLLILTVGIVLVLLTKR